MSSKFNNLLTTGTQISVLDRFSPIPHGTIVVADGDYSMVTAEFKL